MRRRRWFIVLDYWLEVFDLFWLGGRRSALSIEKIGYLVGSKKALRKLAWSAELSKEITMHPQVEIDYGERGFLTASIHTSSSPMNLEHRLYTYCEMDTYNAASENLHLLQQYR